MAVPAAVGDYTKRPSEAARRLQEAMCALTKTCVTYLLSSSRSLELEERHVCVRETSKTFRTATNSS